MAGQRTARYAVGTSATQILRSVLFVRDVHVAHADGLGAAYIDFDSSPSELRSFPLPSNRSHLRIVLEPNTELWGIGTAASDVISVMSRDLCPES